MTTTDEPYRTTVDRLGLEERESEAVRVLGRWRDRLRLRVLVAAAIAGLGTFSVGFYIGVYIQIRIAGFAWIRLAVLVGGACFVATLLAGRQAARIIVRRRTPAVAEQLAADYELPPERLGELVEMLGRL